MSRCFEPPLVGISGPLLNDVSFKLCVRMVGKSEPVRAYDLLARG